MNSKNIHGLIMLEGADAVGKTTLANKIRDIVGERAVIRHLGKPDPGQAWTRDAGALIRNIEEAYQDGKIVIMDRHWLGESIYGALYRNGGEYPHAARYMDMLMNRFRAIRVVCAPPVDVVVENHKKMLEQREEEYKTGMEKVAAAYLQLWEGAHVDSSLPMTTYIKQVTMTGGVNMKAGWLHYDFSKMDVDDFAHYVLKELLLEQYLVKDWQEDIEGARFTGTSSKRSVLLVGDKVNTPEEAPNYPFFANHGSSKYLAEVLHKLCIDSNRLCIANINDPNGPDTVEQLADECGRVIVLGRLAERAMQHSGIEFDVQVRHPQHARRFSHHDDSYRLELGRAFNGWAGCRMDLRSTGGK